MDFDTGADFKIFDSFLESRPEITANRLKQDLERYYVPYAKRLIELKKQQADSKGFIVGISAIQGAGKTTEGEILEILLTHFGHSSVSRSIDDHYITHQELDALRAQDARYIRRGVTHDIPLAILDLRDLQQMTEPTLVAGYDKGAHHGDGDRFRWIIPTEGIVLTAKEVESALHLTGMTYLDSPVNLSPRMGANIPMEAHLLPQTLIDFLRSQTEDVTISEIDEENISFVGTTSLTVSKKELPKGWRLITKKPDFIFYDGWMLGARRVTDESIFDTGLPALETEEAREFAKMINKKLENYEPLWQMINFLNVLYVPNYQMSVQWRDQAEEVLRAKGEGMTQDQIKDFVHYFWRSVHPAIHIKNLANDPVHTQQVVIINDDHSIGEISTPAAPAI